MSVFKSLFHSKVSLSALPDEYYLSFKSFFKTLVLQSTFDIGAIFDILNIAKTSKR